MDDATFGLIHLFHLDDGSLDRMTFAQTFTLGVEWGIVWGRLKAPRSFVETVHVDNHDRVAAMLAAQGRRFKASLGSDGFMSFSVEGLD